MNLTRPSQQIEAFYETAKTTTEPTFSSAFTKNDGAATFGTKSGNLSGATPIVVVPNPDSGITLAGIAITVVNADSVSHNVTLQLNDLGVVTTLGVVTLTAGQQATYFDGLFKISGDAGDVAAVATAESFATAAIAAAIAGLPAPLPVLSAEITVQANATPLVLTNQNTFYAWVAGWSQDINPTGAAISTGAGSITIGVTARVFMSAVLNFTCDQVGGLHIALCKNGTPIPEHLVTIDIVNVNDYISATITGLDDVVDTDVLDIRIESTANAGSSFTLANANFSVFAVGNALIG